MLGPTCLSRKSAKYVLFFLFVLFFLTIIIVYNSYSNLDAGQEITDVRANSNYSAHFVVPVSPDFNSLPPLNEEFVQAPTLTPPVVPPTAPVLTEVIHHLNLSSSTDSNNEKEDDDEDEENISFKRRSEWEWKEDSVYQLVVGECRIPQVPLNHSGIVKRLQFPTINMQNASCDHEYVFSTILHNFSDVVKLTDQKITNATTKCCVSRISRPFGSLANYTVSNYCTPFDPVTHTVPIDTMEYLQVECDGPDSNITDKLFNFHINVPLIGPLKIKHDFWKAWKNEEEMRKISSAAVSGTGTGAGTNETIPKTRSAPFITTPPSILFLVVDSTSRSEFYRSLPQTLKYMMEELNFVEFKGHHGLGEPTLTNAVGLLMGLRNEDFWKQYKVYPLNWWDSAPFIWNTFNQLNYVTGYFEDRSSIYTFFYNGQRPFVHQPTDFFNLPFLVAHNNKHTDTSHKQCFGKRNSLEMIFDHQIQALNKLGPDTPSFFISWPCYPQHDFPHSSLLTQDAVYLSFLQQLRTTPSFKNTMVIITSDHAFNQYEYPQTHAGLIERRVMPLFIKLPRQLRKTSVFPEHGQESGTSDTANPVNPAKEQLMLENLLWNSEGITSHLDIYRTFLHVAEMASERLGAGEVEGIRKYGESLLRKIPHERTCKEAGIPDTMCACNLPPIVQTEALENMNLSGWDLVNDVNNPLWLNVSQFERPFL